MASTYVARVAVQDRTGRQYGVDDGLLPVCELAGRDEDEPATACAGTSRARLDELLR